MRAALLTTVGHGLGIVDDVEIGEPGTGEVRVAVSHCGLCHSDVSQLDGVHPGFLPVILGHEAAGIVESVGDGVTSVAPGDHVVLSPVGACGRCYWCVRGEQQICVNSASIALGMHPDGTTKLSRQGEVVYRGVGLGAMAELAIVAESAAVKLDSDVPLDVACVIGCAVQTGVGAVLNTAQVEPGSTVLVMGAGGIGCAIAAGARLAGATRIIVSDPVEERRERVMAFGATEAVDPSATDVAAAAHRLTGVGVDYAFDAVGSAALVEAGLAAVRNGGTVVMVGAPAVEERASVGVVEAMFAEKKLVGSLLGSCHPQRDMPRLVDLWQSGLLDVDAIVTARRPLDEVNAAVDDMRAGRGIRTVLQIVR